MLDAASVASRVDAGTCAPLANAPPARPYTLIVRTTERCNVGCTHCSIQATPRGLDIDSGLLGDALRGAQRAGVGLVHFSGGEPLLQAALEEQIELAASLGFYVEVTTSTFTRAGDEPFRRLAQMKVAGLQRLMLSYDAAHARRVPIGHYAAYLREALRLDLEVCACVVEWPGTPWPMERVIKACEQADCGVDHVDWCRVELSPIGRAVNGGVPGNATARPTAARCPYVLTAPTLAPDGTVLLCPNLISDAPLFRIGHVRERPLDLILDEFVGSRFYRSLAAHGPGALLERVAAKVAVGCADMCTACQALLRVSEDESVRAVVESLAPAASEAVPVDIDALLPGHRRFVLGEPRPSKGCRCG